jgi:hypothetical protein
MRAAGPLRAASASMTSAFFRRLTPTRSSRATADKLRVIMEGRRPDIVIQRKRNAWASISISCSAERRRRLSGIRGNDGPDLVLTEYKIPRLAELMLFDATSLVLVNRPAENGGPYHDLMSDRESAIMRYQRRLPQARAAMAWNPMGRRSLEAFGQFMTAIDGPMCGSIPVNTAWERARHSTKNSHSRFRRWTFQRSRTRVHCSAGRTGIRQSGSACWNSAGGR